jgi:ferrous iron transport protein A
MAIKYMKRLSDFKKLQSGVITQIDESCISSNKGFIAGEVEARLLEMGFIEGANVKLLHKGMFGGDPIAVRINNNNTMIALRKRDASVILTKEVI